MYLCRIRFRETIPKISFNMSTICINYQLKMLRESLTRVTKEFWPTPFAVWRLGLPNFDSGRSRPCSQGMTRSQNPKDSDGRKMGPIPFW